MQLLPKLKPLVLIFVLTAGLWGCATPSGSNGAGRDAIQLPPGLSVERALRAAAAAGKEMNYTVNGGGNQLVMEKQLPIGVGNIGTNPARHRNRINVTAVPEAAGAPALIRVEGEYLGEIGYSEQFSCLICDVNKIKKAIR